MNALQVVISIRWKRVKCMWSQTVNGYGKWFSCWSRLHTVGKLNDGRRRRRLQGDGKGSLEDTDTERLRRRRILQNNVCFVLLSSSAHAREVQKQAVNLLADNWCCVKAAAAILNRDVICVSRSTNDSHEGIGKSIFKNKRDNIDFERFR